MNDLLRPLFNLFPAMWEKRWWGLAVAWGFALLGAVGVATYKERYMASATVYVDVQSTLRPLLEGLTVQPNISEQVNMLARTLLSRPNINTIINENHLLTPGADALKRERLIQQLTKAIELKINGRDNLYSVSFTSNNPNQTLGVVRSVLRLFVTKGIDSNRKDSDQAVQFIDSQLAIYDSKLRDAENKLKQFKTANPGYSGQATTDYYTRQAQLQDQLTLLQGQLSSAASSRDALRRQLADVKPTLAPQLLPGTNIVVGGQTPDIDMRIAAQRKRLDDLLQRYTDAYPDVIATRQTLARLEREKQQQAKEAPPAAPSISSQYSEATNPVYQQLRISLAQADANVAALQSQMGDVQARLAQLRTQATQMPKLDEQYSQLNRDYNVLNDNYQKLVQRREAALLSRNQDDSRKLDYFRIVDPPRLAPTALFPRRTFLIALVLLLAIALGMLTTYLLVLLVPTYRNARQLRETTDRPVLGSITLVPTRLFLAQDRRNQHLFMLGSGLLVVVFVSWTIVNMLHLIP
ncbi:XrtA system polysaccharide chain length determinant [Thiomonas sp. FB-Cd]|uniref:XrtA system polysaccharide chain length determinant n=1 Tax=Thiomonas sp. FB-Cd TaxID=1158292 RepID=UPI0004DEE61A|nr:XrtA system polysaccharide chain length determinant [Thiomonas sp. FB-Cd]